MTKEEFRKHCEKQIEKCIKLHDGKHLKEYELALALLNENEQLRQKNQELKNQIDSYRNRYKKRLEEKLSEDIETDLEDFYLAEIEGKANDYDKLQREIKRLKTKISIAEEKYKIVSEIVQKYKKVIDKLKEKCKPKTSDCEIWVKLSEDWKTLDDFNKKIRYNLHPIITDAYCCDIKNSINEIIEVTKNEVVLKEDILDILKEVE